MQFIIKHKDNKARTGIITIQRGEIKTPMVTVNFTPALLRSGLKPADVKKLGVDLVLVNTLHSVLAGIDDIHDSLNWDGPVIADSGGFQMISLADKLNITSDGVEFTFDNKKLFFTPELVLEIQRNMGVDMMMPLDYVVSVRKKNLLSFLKSVFVTMRWFKRAFKTGHENLYYIVQGGTSSLARNISLRNARYWLNKGVQAVALGGISLGETKEEIYQTVKYCLDRLPEDKPRHLLGVGKPEDLVKCVGYGIDTFDCVVATREARHGRVWTVNGPIRLQKSEYTDDKRMIDEECDCPTCVSGKTRAELRAGLKAKSSETKIDLMLHNIRFTVRLMENMRKAISDKELFSFSSEFLNKFKIN